VLAVGDHAFQQKCLGKMEDVSRRDGRTVIFVSHNMSAIGRLCHRAVQLDGGRVVANGPAADVVRHYLAAATTVRGGWQRPADRPLHPVVSFLSASVLDPAGSPVNVIAHNDRLTIELECAEQAVLAPWVLRISVYDRMGHELFLTEDIEEPGHRPPQPGTRLRARCSFPAGILKPGLYTVGVSACELAGGRAVKLYEEYEPLFSFEVSEQDFHGYMARGLVAPRASWAFRWTNG